jgi:hypothetical protein
MMTSAIVAGFQMGTSLMAKPFQYIMSGMAERIADEMSDVRAAGGLYAINRLITDQGKQGFLTGGFREAEEVTKENNRYLAVLAGSLPGSTQEYIQVSKQISDGIYRVLSEDKENFMKLGVRVATEEGRLSKAKAIEEGGVKGMQAAGTEVLGEMTKLTVLAGLGGRQGAFGLPQLTERMISDQQVSMGRMQRYSAIFRDPMIMGALERNVAKINQTQANTADRLDKIRGMFQEVVTPELVARYRRTTSGVLEALNTTFLNPEVGLLGLGRPIEGLGKKFNDFGQYLDKLGNVTTEVSEAASADLSLFEGLRDTFAFLYQTIEPILEVIPLIYDPLKDLGIELEKVREVTASVFRRFNEYRVFFEEMGGEFKGTARLRASLATLTQLFTDFGIFNTDDFKRLQDIISGKDFSIEKAGAIVQEMLEKFFDSDLAESIGNAIGRLVGTIIKTVGEMASQVSGIVSAGGLAKGLSEGFKAAGGREGIRLIFKSLIDLFLKAVRELFAAAPLEMSLLAGLTVAAPLLSGLVANGVTSLFQALFSPQVLNFAKTKLMNLLAAATVQSSVLATTPTAITTGAGVSGSSAIGAFLTKMLLPLLGKLALILGAIVFVGGGVENTLRQLSQIFGEIGHNIGGAFSGLFDLLGVLMGFVGDLGRRIGELIGPLFGVTQGFDGLKIVLAPFTLAFQALSQGLRGLALAFAELRVFLARWTGDPEYQQRIQERDKMASDLAAERGRINAYNASMLGPEALRKQINDAVFEVQNSTTLKAARSAELKAFIAEARGQNAPQPAPAFSQQTFKAPPTLPAPAAPALPPQDSEAAKTTASNVQQLNTKAATQISHAAAISNKLTSIQSAAPPNQDSVKIAALQQTVLNTSQINEKAATQISHAAEINNKLASIQSAIPPNQDSVKIAALQQTVLNTSQINEKTAALVTQSTNIFRATDGTQKNTAMANVHLTTINSGVVAVSSKLSGIQSAVVRDLGAIQAGVSSIGKLLASGNIKVQADFNLGGGALGGGDGGPPVFGAAASKLGLTMTSGYRPGDPGYHGLNRARDYSNGSGPTPQMMMFAQFLASTFGKNLKELIYTPMGFSIKNGVKVPPYAQSTHYDHVHVAYALGAGNPAFFSEQRDAVAWEKKFLGRGVESITTNTAELAQAGDGMIGPGWLPWNWGKLVDQERKTNKLNRTNQMLEQMQREGNLPSGMRRISTEGMYPGGGSSVSSAPINVTSPITINQQPGQNADELASIVAMKIGEAVADARAASIFV